MRYITGIGAVVLTLLLVTGSLASDFDEDQTKIFLLILGIHENGAIEESTELKYGHAPNLGFQNGNFTAIVRAQNGTPLLTFDVWDPRNQIDEFGLRNVLAEHEGIEDKSLEQQYVDEGETEDIDLPLIIPYHPDIQTVDLIDKNSGMVLISVNVSPAVETFQGRFPCDPAMIAYSQPRMHPAQSPVNDSGPFLLAGIGLAIILMALLIRLVRKS
jgi:hypothetical protein